MDTSIKRLLEIAGVDITKGKASELYESASGSLVSKIVEILTPIIGKLEVQGIDEDGIERSIDDWFEDLKEQVRKKL